MTENDLALHDARYFAVHGEFPPIVEPTPTRVRAREVADEIVRGVMAKGVAKFCAHEFEVVQGEGRLV